MKVLFLCNKSPFPPLEGGPLAMNACIQSLLKAGHHVKVLALNTNKYYIDPASIPETYRKQTGIELIDIDLSLKPGEAFIHLFSGKSYHVERFISDAFRKRLTEVLTSDSFDVIQLEMLYMTPYTELIRKHSGAAVIMRSHNIEHLIWERITQKTKNPLKRAYLSHLTRQLRKYELHHLNSYDGIAAITRNDADFFKQHGCMIPLTDIPFGVEVKDYPAEPDNMGSPALFHLGSMNWVPNLEGITWFLNEVWPLIHKHLPELRLHLAGRGMPEKLLSMKLPNVEMAGEVPDAQAFIRSYAIMVVPLFSGSGIRIKIIEGMAMGKAIISTKIGAEGIRYTHGENILIANTPEEFLAAVTQCIQSPQLCSSLGQNARQLIEDEHSLEQVIAKLEKFYSQVLRK
jgi:polysaccharide biosynthesis protein PslH